MPLGYVMWWWKCAEQQWLFKLFLCSWLTLWLTLWSCCRSNDLGFTVANFICFWLALVGRQHHLQHCGDSLWCVCVVTHAHSLVCCLVVCVCKSSLGLVLWRDQLGSLIISPSFYLFANLPSGFATWLNDLVVVLFAGINLMLQGSWRSSSTRLNED
jgi:hypothetical protein